MSEKHNGDENPAQDVEGDHIALPRPVDQAGADPEAAPTQTELARQILEHLLNIEKLKVKNAEEHNRLRSIELSNQLEIERLRAEAFRLYHLNQNETALQRPG